MEWIHKHQLNECEVKTWAISQFSARTSELSLDPERFQQMKEKAIEIFSVIYEVFITESFEILEPSAEVNRANKSYKNEKLWEGKPVNRRTTDEYFCLPGMQSILILNYCLRN